MKTRHGRAQVLTKMKSRKGWSYRGILQEQTGGRIGGEGVTGASHSVLKTASHGKLKGRKKDLVRRIVEKPKRVGGGLKKKSY